jgi:hypothetical protein
MWDVPKLKTVNKRNYILRILTIYLFCSLGCSCTNTPLNEYIPKDSDEAEIVLLLIRYQNARINFDLERYLGCLHEDGVYHHASRVMVTKKELSFLLPDFWTQLQKGDRIFFPMCRENLSGNYFVGFKLTNPEIRVNLHTADVTVTYVNKGWRQKHYIYLEKENNRWFIKGLDWETG